MSYYVQRKALSGVAYGRGGLVAGQWAPMGSLGEEDGGFWSDIVGQTSSAWDNVSTSAQSVFDTVRSTAQSVYDEATSAVAPPNAPATTPVQCPPIANGFTVISNGKCELANCNIGYTPSPDRTACIKSNEGEYCDLKGGTKGIVVGGKCVEATPLPPGFENIPEGAPCQLKAGTPGGGVGKGGKCVPAKAPPSGGGGSGGFARGGGGGAMPPPAPGVPATKVSTVDKLLKNPLTWVGAAVVVGGIGLVIYKKRQS